MKPIKKILVGLDLSEMDKQLISYTSFITKLFDVEKVYFVHNIKRYEISEMLEKELQDIDLEELITEEINENVEDNFKSDVEWEVLISDDPYTESLISYIVNKYSIDLLMMGNKNNEDGSGLLAFKLLRTTRCQFLWIPKNTNNSMDKVWVGTDFSNTSKKCFAYADFLNSKHNFVFEAVHVYNLPIHFSPYVNNSKIEPKMKDYVDKKFDNFLKKIKFSGEINQIKILGREANIASKLKKEAYKNNVDLLIVADKGANTISNLTLGSITEDLFNRDLKIPLFIVKD
ncbi:Nucleotide-binding universal stress protein, UspA family [Psychroflexus salarius]|uniref:Nucleotide-binding universal stress protein, UspA family n=1 Tax=Psychroflexus salarius TaxID=1155689 RepID=A0A1M4W4B9_9FLAO|nr:universal stress protein [Psychroflexus salarius]SHE76144.1 Nucleotide-binding universal stress protein, UspA family [Psychroflexus salarius]